MNIRTRLTVLSVSVLLPAFIAGALAVLFVYQEQQAAQEKSIAEASHMLARLIDKEIESSETFLKSLAASPDLAAGNLERVYHHAKTLSRGGENTLILSTPQGQQIFNTRQPFGAPQRTVNPRLLQLRMAADTERTVVSDLFLAPLAQRYDIAIQVPVTVGGALRYYMSRGIAAASLQRFLNSVDLPDNWIASVVDREGSIIARSVSSDRFVGKRATGDLAARIARAETSGINDGHTLEGVPVKAFFHRAPKSEWTVIVSVPVAELNGPALRASLLLTAMMLVVLAGAVLLTRRYAVRIMRPVQQLCADARHLGRGETVQPFRSGLAEVDEVNAGMVFASTQIREAKADMERRVAEAIDSTERAQRALLRSQKLEALGRLTGGVAHDFNNVLQTLTSSLQMITLEEKPEKIPQRIAVCEKAVARATALVAQLRAFGRTQEAYLETVRADRAVLAALPMLKNGLPSTIRLQTDLPDTIWSVTVDLTQFEMAVLNLVMNARDAIPGHGTITIVAANHIQDTATGVLPAGAYVCIRIADTGSGMTPDVLSKAFDPFFTTKSVDKGNGLGLPQAYGFATQSGGTLVLDSFVGQGTTAALYLPRAREAVTAVPVAPTGFAHPDVRLHGTLLFVEDDKLIADSVVPILEQAGARVLCAGNADEALALLAREPEVDVLFSDIVMPGSMNGLMLAKHVKERHPDIVIVLATGYFNENVDLPDATLLTKPYKSGDLLRAIADAMSAGLAG